MLIYEGKAAAQVVRSVRTVSLNLKCEYAQR